MTTMTVAEAQAAYEAAFASNETIQAQLERAKEDAKRHQPAAAVAAGLDVLEAAAAHDAAVTKVGYLLDAEEASRLKFQSAWQAVCQARTMEAWTPRVEAAVKDRLAALADIEKARTSLADAEKRFLATSQALTAAFGAGYPRPAWLQVVGARLDEYGVAAAHVPILQHRALADEAALWEGVV